MNAEDLIRCRNHPVDEGRLFQISDTIKPRRDPVFGRQHVAGDLRLDCVYIVHKMRWADDVNEKNEGSY